MKHVFKTTRTLASVSELHQLQGNDEKRMTLTFEHEPHVGDMVVFEVDHTINPAIRQIKSIVQVITSSAVGPINVKTPVSPSHYTAIVDLCKFI